MDSDTVDKDKVDKETLASLKFKAELKLLPIVLRAVRDVACRYGLDEASVRDLELATEEACHNVIEHAYEPGEEGYYQVKIHREPTCFRITVRDQGMPFNLQRLNDEEPSDIGVKLMRACTDEIRSKYLGKRGKVVELVKNFPFESVNNIETSNTKSLSSEVELAPASEKVILRMMRPDETVSLARLIYRVYGYTYPHEDIYYPEKFASLIESGLVTSCVAVNEQDEIIGHLGVFLETPEDHVGESALAAVDPRYRGRGLFPRMKKMMMEEVVSKGLLGLYSRAVTVHVASQKSNVKMGAKETGFVLAHSPPTAIFKKMKTEIANIRRTVALFYVPVAPDREETVFLPNTHREIINKIYKHTELPRVFKQADPAKVDLAPHSHIHSHILPEMASAFLRVKEFGVDFIDELRLQVQDLKERKIELIVLDLPLKDPGTAILCPEIEKMNFFFCGIMPEYLDGDSIRLQHLNNVAFDPESVDVYSEFAQEIFNYVVGEWKNHYRAG
ncbi:GNAT family N-acetyltransferase [Methanobacterium sp.]|uniref:GNAT family N-acetyltransferase n=1 Tax=Methanobacterium sp. TaxID=2164 RepID=UPI0025EE9DAE|nr:GNAT family N-acetyltransferase [Methanobacterium sp.]MBI5458601.1 GNAT family N-acetyltransferase [Methanobacterium sp.]